MGGLFGGILCVISLEGTPSKLHLGGDYLGVGATSHAVRFHAAGVFRDCGYDSTTLQNIWGFHRRHQIQKPRPVSPKNGETRTGHPRVFYFNPFTTYACESTWEYT